MKQLKIKKADIILIAALLALSLIFLFMRVSRPAGSIEVSVDGKLYGEYSLAKDRIIEVETEFGKNTIEIKGGAAYVSQADCPNGDCMRFAPISKSGQVIACVPHKLSVRAIGGGELDAVVY